MNRHSLVLVSTVVAVALALSFTAATAFGEGEGPPRWVIDRSSLPPYSAVGRVEVRDETTVEMATAMAESKAMASLAKLVGRTVVNVVTTVSEVEGLDGEVLRRVSKRVEETVTEATLYGAARKDRWTSADGVLYVLVAIDDPGLVKRSIRDSLGDSYREERGSLDKTEEKALLDAIGAAIDGSRPSTTFNIGIRG